MTIGILAFAVFSATSIEQSDKVFAKSGVSGDKLSNAEKMKVIENVLGTDFWRRWSK